MNNILNNKLIVLTEPCHGMGTTAFSELVAKEASVDGRVLVFGNESNRYKIDKTTLYCLDDVTRLENIVNNCTEKISLIIYDYLPLFIKKEVELKDFLSKVTKLAKEKDFGVLLLTSLGRPGTTHCVADFRNNFFDDFEATRLVLHRDGFANSNEDQTTARVQLIKYHKNEDVINLLWNAETRSFSWT